MTFQIKLKITINEEMQEQRIGRYTISMRMQIAGKMLGCDSRMQLSCLTFNAHFCLICDSQQAKTSPQNIIERVLFLFFLFVAFGFIWDSKVFSFVPLRCDARRG